MKNFYIALNSDKFEIVPLAGQSGMPVVKIPYKSAQVFSANEFNKINEIDTSFPVVVCDVKPTEELTKKLTEFFDAGGGLVFCSGNIFEKIKISELAMQKSVSDFSCILIEPKPLLEKNAFGFSDLKQILRVLRAPGGCPWDRVQTHESLRTNVVEEAYELVDAIDKSDIKNIEEELGDCILQAFFHTEIARESGEFDYRDILTTLCKKLIGRHTHIFGSDSAQEAGQALRVWERNKAIEKGLNSVSESIASLPEALPALMKAFKIQKKAAKAGFDWADVSGAVSKVREEFEELNAEIAKGDKAATEDEFGDLLFAFVNVCRFLEIEPETALNKANAKFARRFEFVERKLKERGKTFEQSDLAEMDKLWDLAKESGL